MERTYPYKCENAYVEKIESSWAKIDMISADGFLVKKWQFHILCPDSPPYKKRHFEHFSILLPPKSPF